MGTLVQSTGTSVLTHHVGDKQVNLFFQELFELSLLPPIKTDATPLSVAQVRSLSVFPIIVAALYYLLLYDLVQFIKVKDVWVQFPAQLSQ